MRWRASHDQDRLWSTNDESDTVTRIDSHPAPIRIEGLRKHFGRTVALDGLDLDVRAGEVHGFLGPNGAGKARLRGGADPSRRDELVERFHLDPTKKGRAYSKGNRQKVALVAALAADVELLLLDEPTAGLDPLMEQEFRSVIDEERGGGRTVLLSSHLLSEVEALCDRVSIIRDGVTVETGSLSDLRHLTRTSVTAEVEHEPVALSHLRGLHDLVVEPADGGYRVRAHADAGALAALLGVLVDAGVRSLVSQPPTLEELFLEHYASDGPTRP